MLFLSPQTLLWKVGGGMKPRFHQTKMMCVVCEFQERCTCNINIIHLKIKYVHEFCFQFLLFISFQMICFSLAKCVFKDVFCTYLLSKVSNQDNTFTKSIQSENAFQHFTLWVFQILILNTSSGNDHDKSSILHCLQSILQNVDFN